MRSRIKKQVGLLVIVLLLTQACVLDHSIPVSCDVAHLIAAIDTANADPAHDTLELASNCVYLLTEVETTVTHTFDGSTFEYGDVGLPPITTPITINGNNATISRALDAPYFRIFHILGSGSLTLNYLTVENGYADATSGENLSVFPGSGGAIYNDGALLTINHSNLRFNTAQYYGGAIFTCRNATTYLDDTLLSDNSAAATGGGISIYHGGLLSVERSQIINNDAGTNGGGIAAGYGAELIIRISEISFNHAGRQGGGIFKIAGADRLPTTISGSTFQGNTAEWSGGGIYIRGTALSIAGSLFLENQAAEYGGGLSFENSSTESVSIRSTTFEKNTARMDGGGIHFWGELLNISYSAFNSNSAENGGAIHNGQGALPTSSIRPDSTMIIQRSDLTHNSADTDGGGIFNSGTLTVGICVLASNSASSLGGGIHNLGELIVQASTFEKNEAGEDGGGLSTYRIATVTESTFVRNSARRGGGLASISGDTVLTNDTFSENTALEMGGGIFNLGNAPTEPAFEGTMAVSYLTVAYNRASTGGGIATSGGMLKISSSIVAHSLAGADCYTHGDDFLAVAENLATDASCPGFTLKIDPLLKPLGDYGGPTQTHALAEDSPAIDAAPLCMTNAGVVLTLDQPGQPRPMGLFCDLGAYEFSTTLVPPTAPSIRLETDANCRAGTSPQFPVLAYLSQGQELPLLGINSSRTWYLVRPPGQEVTCWVWAQLGVLLGDLNGLEVVPDPAFLPPTQVVMNCGDYTNRDACENQSKCVWYIPPPSAFKPAICIDK